MSNSKLVNYTKLTSNCNKPRNNTINKITIHHVAGVATVEGLGATFSGARKVSAQYGIGNDGRIGMYVEEKDRAWTSSNAWNDHQAITIEVSNSAGAPNWPVGEKAFNSLIDLCVDICKRNPNIKQKNGKSGIYFDGTKNGSLTIHKLFAATACLPINTTELLTKNGWKLLKDIKIGDEVAQAHIDDLSISFGPVLNLIEEHKHDTYSIRDLEATSDHRIIWYNQPGTQYVGQLKDIYNKKGSIYLPNAGYYNGKGIDISLDELELLIAIQADGHYMWEDRIKQNGVKIHTGEKHFTGIEFHLKKERKINRIKELLDRLNYKYSESLKSDGSVAIRIYNTDILKFAEKYLDNKVFTWKLLELSKEQATFFLDKVLDWDGCREGNYYSSAIKQNTDIVSAIASINGVGIILGNENNAGKVIFNKDKRSLGDGVKTRHAKTLVGCVTVATGFILIRQKRRTTIVGNCPGPYLESKLQDICNLVNARLAGQEDTPTPTPPISKELYRIRKTWQDVNSQKGAFLSLDGAITELKKYEGYNIYNSAGEQVYPKIEKIEIGDIVKIKPGSKTYDGKNPASFVFAGEYSVDELNNDRAILDKKGIYSPFNIKDLTLISKKNENNKEDIVPEEIGTSIFGELALTAKQLAAFLLKTNPNPKINCDAVKLAEYFINEGKKLGIRGDIAFAQSINETGWFKYGGDVLPEQNNFCGLGAVNGASVGKGAWFETPELGVRAQIQHLFAYATKDNLPSDTIIVDPRFTFVNRGVAKYWENLGGKWAVPGYPSKYKTWDEAWTANATYGQVILRTYDNIVEFAKTYVEKTPEEIAVGDAIDKEIIMNYTHWLNILNGKEEVTTNELLELFQEINRRIK